MPGISPDPLTVTRRAVLLVAVAAATLLALRAHVAERYRVTSHSMEPTLHGGGPATVGDVLLVDKTPRWTGLGDLERGDLLVVRNRLEAGGDPLIKRLVARGPATVEFRDGDLWVRSAGEAIVKRVVKDPLAWREQLPVARTVTAETPELLEPGEGDLWRRGADGALRVAARPGTELVAARRREQVAAREQLRPPGHLSLADPVDSSFLDRAGQRRGGPGRWPRDIGSEVRIVPGPGVEAIHLVHQYQDAFHTAVVGVDGRGRWLRNGLEAGPGFECTPWATGRERELWAGYLDGRFFLVVDRALRSEWAVPLASPGTRRPRLGGSDPNLLHVAVDGRDGASASLHGWTVRFDPYWPAEDRPFELEIGDLFLLGDNAYESSDSRDLPGESFREEDVIGRALAVIAPAARVRGLSAPAMHAPR